MSPVLFLKRPTAWLEAMSRVPRDHLVRAELRLRAVSASGQAVADWRARSVAAGAWPGAAPSRFAPTRCGVRRALRPGRLQRVELRAELRPGRAFARRHVLPSRAQGRLGRRRTGWSANPVPSPSPIDVRPAVRLVCCGRAFSRARHPHRRRGRTALPDRHVGRIVVRGPSVMAGYFEDPEATAETLRDGWLAHGRSRLPRRRRAVRLRTNEGPDHPAGPQVSPAGSRVGDCRPPRDPGGRRRRLRRSTGRMKPTRSWRCSRRAPA